MKYLIVLLLILTNAAKADTMELVAGSITEHFIAPYGTEWFTRKLGDRGKLIYNPLYALRYTKEYKDYYKTVSIFYGNNSIGYPMMGGTFSYGWKALKDHLYYGGVIGAYYQEIGLDNPTSFMDKIINTGMVPVLGVEINGKINIGFESFLKVNNLITPILSSTSISFGINI